MKSYDTTRLLDALIDQTKTKIDTVLSEFKDKALSLLIDEEAIDWKVGDKVWFYDMNGQRHAGIITSIFAHETHGIVYQIKFDDCAGFCLRSSNDLLKREG